MEMINISNITDQNGTIYYSNPVMTTWIPRPATTDYFPCTRTICCCERVQCECHRECDCHREDERCRECNCHRKCEHRRECDCRSRCNCERRSDCRNSGFFRQNECCNEFRNEFCGGCRREPCREECGDSRECFSLCDAICCFFSAFC